MRVDTKQKIVSLVSLKRRIAQYRREGKSIAFTNGCFDILHYGHVNYLQKAKKPDRILIIGLNGDKSIKKIKGPKRPIVAEKERACVLAALACVDHVTIFQDETPFNLINALKPDILIKGSDWKGRDVAGSDIVKASGGKVEYMRYIPGSSSTSIIETVLKRYAEK